MHYADGKPAKLGDLLIYRNRYRQGNGSEIGSDLVGILVSGSTQSTTCNGMVVPVVKRTVSEIGVGPWIPVSAVGGNDWSVTLKDCLEVNLGEATNS